MTRSDIEVVGSNVVYKGIVSVPLETVQDLAQGYGFSDVMILELMEKVYNDSTVVRRNSRITDILGDDNKG